MILASSGEKAVSLDPLDLVFGSSGPVAVVLWLLVLAALLAWTIWFAKWLQLGRLAKQHRTFEEAANRAADAGGLLQTAEDLRTAPGASIVRAIGARLADDALTSELLEAVATRAVAAEEQRAAALMPTLSSIASASPFIGLFGTVWGIMEAFLAIGVEKSASLPVVAPAIGEALIATAVGLAAAIPATIAYNFIDRRIGTLLDELNASADVWTARLYAEETLARSREGRAG